MSQNMKQIYDLYRAYIKLSTRPPYYHDLTPPPPPPPASLDSLRAIKVTEKYLLMRMMYMQHYI